MKRKKIKLAYIGLGKMGFNMVEKLIEEGYKVIAYDPDQKARKKIAEKGAVTVDNYKELISKINPPRLVWIMVPHSAVDEVLGKVLPYLEKEDTVIDGGNSPYQESMLRERKLKKKSINFLDAGVSGGPGGVRRGACIMVGGEIKIFKRYQALFRNLATKDGYGYMGKSGAGHFVKMVHNGIEYGMMQALAEGFSLMKKSPFRLNLTKVADVYNHKSVIESRLVGWLKNAFKKYGEDLKEVTATVAHTGEGQWTVKTAKELKVPVDIIKGAFQYRLKSQKKPSYTGKILSALRNQFGHHAVSPVRKGGLSNRVKEKGQSRNKKG